MGTFGVALSVKHRGVDDETTRESLIGAICLAVQHDYELVRGAGPADRSFLVVAFPGQPWLTVFDNDGPSAHPDVQSLAASISQTLNHPVVVSWMGADELMGMDLFKNGKQVDQLEVVAEDLGGDSSPHRIRSTAGRPDAWEELADNSNGRGRLRQVWRGQANPIEEMALIARLIGFSDQWWLFTSDDAFDDFSLSPTWLRFRRRQAALSPAGKIGDITHCVPAALCGTHAEVARRWQRIAADAIDHASWNRALQNGDWIPLDAAPGGLVLDGPNPWLHGQHVLLYPVLREVSNLLATEDHAQSFSIMSQLILEGINSLWFCLGILGAYPIWLPNLGPSHEQQQRQIAIAVLEKLLVWWPDLCALEPRFSQPPLRDWWPLWGRQVVWLSGQIGIAEQEMRYWGTLPAIAAGERIGQSLSKVVKPD